MPENVCFPAFYVQKGDFSKAFSLIFEKGTGVIEKTYRRDELEKSYKINDYAAKVRNDQKSMRVFSKKAAGGAYDVLYMKRVSDYAQMKYHRRFCRRRMSEKELE